MNMLTKVFVVTNAVFALLFLAVVFTLWSKEVSWVKATQAVIGRYNLLDREHNQLKLTTQRQVDELTQAKTHAESLLTEARIEKERVSTELSAEKARRTDTDTKFNTVSNALDSQSKQVASLQADVKAKDAENKKLREELALSKAVEESATLSQRAIANELMGKEDQLKTLMGQIRELRERNKVLADASSTGSGVVAPLPSVNILAKIERVDAERGLVVLNAGERQGVRKNMEFMVTNDSTGWIGRVRVNTIESDYSVAYILPITPQPIQIAAGDTASTGT